MSDLSFRHCTRCEQPEYACECADTDATHYVDPPINWLLRGENIPPDHPFLKTRQVRKEAGE